MVLGIIDLAHCGTTMVAGILERIGVPMVWSRGRAGKLEDLDVVEALNAGAPFAQLVEKRGDTTWGFKYPGAWKYAQTLRECLPGAVYVAIYKDPVSVTLRRFGAISGNKLAQTVRWMAESVDGINARGLPVHWLSYNDAMRRPCAFTERLARLAGVTVTGGQMDAVLGWIFPATKEQR